MTPPELFPESIVACPAKINLHLSILGLRSDGYHELRTLFYPVTGLYDTLRIEPGHDQHMFMSCPERPELETGANLIYKAWKAYGEATGYMPGMFITLNKRIPMGGGLGGGSSNAATMLRWLNENAGDRALKHTDLIQLAAKLGADIPFFLLDGPAWASGIGDTLTPATLHLSGMHLVIALPDIHIDTPKAFRAWDEINGHQKVSEALTTADNDNKTPSPVSPLIVMNDFESVVFPMQPRLRKIKETLIQNGAASAAMSGSGASVFGLYHDKDSAGAAVQELEKEGIENFSTVCQ
jgi:4-diphosphocytidyl-2-C-methyl-D-erythritol kinase